MSIFYDPRTKKAKPIVIIIFILTPIIVCALFYVIAKNIAQRISQEDKDSAKTVDIFNGI